MLIRPTDSAGDLLPVTAVRDLLSGTEAVALLVRHRLSLLKGDWWENPNLGNTILDFFSENRVTEADQGMISALLSSYIRETPGVLDVEDERIESSGRQMRYSCRVKTQKGETDVLFSAVY